MSAVGFTPIQLYRTTTASAAPVAGNLADGELALNTTDEKLYFKNASGVVKLLAWNGVTDLSSPPPIGNTTPNTGAFTTLSATGVISADSRLRFTANGYTNVDAQVAKSSAYGLILQGATGSSYDFGLTSAGGTLDVIRVPTGTNTVQLVGAATVGAGLAVTGTLSASSTATLAAINQSDIFTNTSTNANPIRVTGATTGASYVRVTNTGGDYVFGAENSTGVNNLIVGATGYDMIIRAPSGIAFSANAGSAMQMRLSSAGLAVTGTGSYTDNVTIKKTSGLIEFRQNDNSRTGYVQETSGNLAIVGERAGSSLQLYSNNTLNATLDASGQLGLGVTPSAWGANFKAMQFNGLYGGAVSTSSASNTSTNLSHCAYHNGTNWIYGATGFGAARYEIDGPSGGATHKWFTAASGTAGNTITFTQAMTLDASGNLLVGKSATNSATVGFEARALGGTSSTMAASTNATSTLEVYSTGAAAFRFYVGMGGTINATSATITAISDRRFKENIKDLDDGLSSVMALQPRSFDWRAGKGKGIKGDRGFIAQEFEQVFPDLIDEWKDPAPEGEEPYKAVRADLIPVLVKAIQEQQALITSLTARVAQLEGI